MKALQRLKEAVTLSWKARRRYGMGGSDIGRLMHYIDGSPVSPYGTASDVYLEKVEGHEIEPNAAMEWGNRLEQSVADRYAEGLADDEDLRDTEMVQHPEYPMFLGTPDRLVYRGDECLWGVEIKTSVHGRGWGAKGSNSFPDHYRYQVMWYMGILRAMGLDIEFFDIAAFIYAHVDYREITVEWDPYLFNTMRSAALAFWRDHVETKTPPPPTSPGDDALMSKMQRQQKEDMLDNTADTESLATSLQMARHMTRQFESAEKMLSARLKYLIGPFRGVEGVCTYKNTKDRSHVSWPGIAKDVAAALSSGDLTRGQWESILNNHTSLRPGHRQLRFTSDLLGDDVPTIETTDIQARFRRALETTEETP